MGDDELPRNVFPETDTYLFVGGPEHGKRREVCKDDPIFKVMAPPQPNLDGNSVFLAPGGYEAHTYVRRELAFQDGVTGEQYVREVYLHEGIPNPQIAEQMLMAALLVDFIRGGRKVTTENDNSPRPNLNP
jgi:hypothetical protein